MDIADPLHSKLSQPIGSPRIRNSTAAWSDNTNNVRKKDEARKKSDTVFVSEPTVPLG
jgi:hypothetical protein